MSDADDRISDIAWESFGPFPVQTPDGNLTALEAIQSRKKPEPWIPSVDEFDLLPDAGTSYRSPR